MINGITAAYQSYQNYSLYGAQRAQNAHVPSVRTAVVPAAQPETPVTPVAPVRASSAVGSGALDKSNLLLRWENDPAAMAVRNRIQYGSAAGEAGEAGTVSEAGKSNEPGKPGEAELPGKTGLPGEAEKAGRPGLPGEDEKAPSADGSSDKVESAQETMEEAECQTCKERKYQDGSDDPGVSFKTAAHIDPSRAAAVVRGHEQEHVTREQAKASREDREVVSQSVTLHTGICPECGRAYVSGGTTRTVTRAAEDTLAAQAAEKAADGEDAA